MKVPPAAKHPLDTTRAFRLRTILIFGAATVLIVALATIVAWSSLPHALTASDRAVLKQYESIGGCLANDDLPAAREAAKVLYGSFPNIGKISKAAASLQKSETLESARLAFQSMSEEAVILVEGHDDFYVMSCSMDRCPAKCVNCTMARFGSWVQSTPVVRNPFMGKASPTCGVIDRPVNRR